MMAPTLAAQWRRGFRVDAYLKAHPDANSESADIEDLVQQGRAGGPCPYFLSREMAAGADLVLMPYNYLVDARTRFGMKGIQWRGSVLIFDEAHNVEVRGLRRASKHVIPAQTAIVALHLLCRTMCTVLRSCSSDRRYSNLLAHNAPASECLECCVCILGCLSCSLSRHAERVCGGGVIRPACGCAGRMHI
jgi:Rad3-related DNA helicase